MKVFVCNDHEGYWPVPTASVIVARNKSEAEELFREELRNRGFNDNAFTLKELDITKQQVEMLSDGDY